MFPLPVPLGRSKGRADQEERDDFLVSRVVLGQPLVLACGLSVPESIWNLARPVPTGGRRTPEQP